MIALWEKPHRLLVKSEPNPFGGGHEFRAHTADNGCTCKEIVAAIVLDRIGLEVDCGVALSGPAPSVSATMKLGALDVKFCPLCGKSVKLLEPRIDWISNAGEKTRV